MRSCDGACADFAPARSASFHARSSRLNGSRSRAALPLGAWLGRSATSSVPLYAPLRNHVVFLANIPTEASGHPGARGTRGINHPSCVHLFRKECSSPSLCGLSAVASSAREVGRPLYGGFGKFKDATGRLDTRSPLPFLLELPESARGLLLGFHAHHRFAARQNRNLN